MLLPRSSAGLQLLQQVRDESHRFAVTFQRGKRRKQVRNSWLDTIPGVGEKRKMKLLQSFKTIQAIQSSSRESLAKVVGKRIADAILNEVAQLRAEGGAQGES
ncbi:MAG: hypothetical protein F6K07_33130 [Okeania sp. SIO1H5]|nr:hypothetical protein [Okeania sp. SIO1H5]